MSSKRTAGQTDRKGRVPHYLSVPTCETWPKKVLVFQAHHKQICEADGVGDVEIELDYWTLSVLELSGTDYIETCKTCGTTAGDFWTDVRHFMRGCKLTWLIGFNVMPQLAMLDYWVKVEEDEWLLAWTDPRKQPIDNSYEDRSATGHCVLEDPPVIIMTRHKRASNLLQIVDVRNYGLDRSPSLASGEATLEALVDWIVSYTRSLRVCALGSIQATAACQAFNGWRRSYMKAPVLVHCNYAALSLERAALFSGRNECFRVGRVNGPVYHLDFNSMYPAVAEALECPARLKGDGAITIAQLYDLVARGYAVCAKVKVELREPWLPKRLDMGTVFPVGSFTTSLAWPELELAIESGCVYEVLHAAWYECSPLFETWVRALFSARASARQRNDAASASVYKRIANSLYGKFAQRYWTWRDSPDTRAGGPFECWFGRSPEASGAQEQTADDSCDAERAEQLTKRRYCRWRSIGWRVQYQSEQSEHRNSCPAIAAWVYSAARVKLLEAMRIAGRGNVYYVDADSVWCNNDGYNALERLGMLHSEQLGKLKLVETCEWVKFYGLKHYDTPNKQVHAGVPAHAKRLPSGAWEHMSAERVASALRNDRAPLAILSRKSYQHTGRYKHGHVDLLGRVTPLTINER